MGRPRRIDPAEVVQRFRDGTYLYGSEAARAFGCSRVRIHQILEEHAPELMIRRTPAQVAPQEAAARKKRRAALIKETVAALKAHETVKDAAAALGLTPPGLQNRIRRYGLDSQLD